MAENLNYAYLQPTSTLDSSSWCYNNEPDSCAKYGRLYLWSAALDSAAQFNEDSKGCGYGPLQPNPENYLVFCNQFHIRGACPQHWHLPSLHDFLYLDDIANSSAIVLKSIDDWEDNENGTNVFGFNILPAGYCHSEGNVSFHLIKQTSRFWAFEVGLCPYIDDMQIVYNENEPLFLAGSAYAGDAYSIRCVKDTVLGLQVSQGSMTDERDGQVYKTVTIGKQTWMAENLNYAYLQPTSTLDSSSWCYNNEPDSCAKYGRLYLWSAAVEACPEKWHLPSQSEMETLIIAMDYNASLMKSTSGWMDYSDGLDSYGITILPAGLLDTREINTSPIFKGIQEQAFLWSESPDESLPAYQSRKYVAAAIAMTLDNKHSGAYFSSVNVGYANSVRCVKDE
jgi:uncharacterized protein (TIGR02145 family)